MATGSECWDSAHADRFALIVDADDYFRHLRAAMLQARHSIMLIAWDFDARIRLGEPGDDGPERLGDFLLWLADRRPGLQIRLLRWDTGALKAMFRGNTLWTVLRWKAHRQITLKLDGAHPLASSHHQKIVVIDESLAFCGGIDMTIDRWDTRAHLDDDPRRVSPGGRRHGPWHDATAACDGAAARLLGQLGAPPGPAGARALAEGDRTGAARGAARQRPLARGSGCGPARRAIAGRAHLACHARL